MSSVGVGSVEVRFTGTVDPSLTASSAEAIGEIDAVNAAAEAWGKKLGGVSTAAATVTTGMKEVSVAADVTTHAMGNTRAVTESLVVVHEALQGRLSRIPGSLMILTQALTGGSTATLLMGAGVLALVGGLGFLEYEALKDKKALDDLTAGFAMTGRQAEFSSSHVSEEVDFLSKLPGVSRAAAEGFMTLAARHADWSFQLTDSVGQLMPAFVKVYGKEAPEAAGKLAETLSNLTAEGFQKLDREMLNLAPDQYEMIQNLIRTGREAEAVDLILKGLSKSTGDYIKSAGDHVYDDFMAIKGLEEDLKNAKISDPFGSEGLQQDAEKRLAAARKKLADDQAAQQDQHAQEEANQQKRAIDDINKESLALDQKAQILDKIARLQRDASSVTVGSNEYVKAQTAIADAQAKLTHIYDEEAKKVTDAQKREANSRISIAQTEVSEEEALSRESGARIIAHMRQVGEEMKAIRQSHLQTDLEISQLTVSGKKADLDREVANGEISAQQKMQTLLELARAEAALNVQELQQENQTLDEGSVEYQRNANKIRLIEKKLQADLSEIRKEGAQAQRTEDNKAVAEAKRLATEEARVESGLVNDILFSRQSLWMTLANAAQNYLKKEITLLFEHEAQKTAAVGAGEAARLAEKESAHAAGAAADAAAGSATILNDAYKAAAGAYSAVAEIPIVGPILAPIAAGVAFGAVSVFDVMTSAEGGSYNVGGGGLFNLHEEESVMPRAIADPMRDFFESGAGGGQGGDTYNLHAHVHAETLDSAGLGAKLEDHADTLIGILASKMRNGSRGMKALG